MDVRSLLRHHGDPLLGLVVAAVFVTEVVLWEDAALSRAVPGALLAGLPLAFRRRSPLLMFVLVGVGIDLTTRYAPGLDDQSMGIILAIFLSLYSVGRHARGVEAWLGGLGVIAYTGLFVASDGDGFYIGDVVFAVAFLGTPWGIGLALRLRRDRERVLGEENRRLQEESVRAVAAERARIARELHDVVSHAIAVTVLQARGGRKLLGVDDAGVRQALDAIEETNTQALGDMRRLLSLLRDTDTESRPDPQPSLARLDDLLAHLNGSGLPVRLEVRGEPGHVPPGVDLSAYRIIQEALTNVLKHAGPDATSTVEIDYAEDALVVTVTDDGRHPVAVDGHGHGLLGIRERVAVVGGEVETGPGESGGFVVRARLPYALETSS